MMSLHHPRTQHPWWWITIRILRLILFWMMVVVAKKQREMRREVANMMTMVGSVKLLNHCLLWTNQSLYVISYLAARMTTRAPLVASLAAQAFTTTLDSQCCHHKMMCYLQLLPPLHHLQFRIGDLLGGFLIHPPFMLATASAIMQQSHHHGHRGQNLHHGQCML